MGNWTATISGVGPHHNNRNDIDVEKKAAAFIDDLKAAGHTVQKAGIAFDQPGKDINLLEPVAPTTAETEGTDA